MFETPHTTQGRAGYGLESTKDFIKEIRVPSTPTTTSPNPQQKDIGPQQDGSGRVGIHRDLQPSLWRRYCFFHNFHHHGIHNGPKERVAVHLGQVVVRLRVGTLEGHNLSFRDLVGVSHDAELNVCFKRGNVTAAFDWVHLGGSTNLFDKPDLAAGVEDLDRDVVGGNEFFNGGGTKLDRRSVGTNTIILDRLEASNTNTVVLDGCKRTGRQDEGSHHGDTLIKEVGITTASTAASSDPEKKDEATQQDSGGGVAHVVFFFFQSTTIQGGLLIGDDFHFGDFSKEHVTRVGVEGIDGIVRFDKAPFESHELGWGNLLTHHSHHVDQDGRFKLGYGRVTLEILQFHHPVDRID